MKVDLKIDDNWNSRTFNLKFRICQLYCKSLIWLISLKLMIKLRWDQSVYCTLEYKQIIYSFIFLLYLPKSVNMRTKIMKVRRPSFLFKISFTAIRWWIGLGGTFQDHFYVLCAWVRSFGSSPICPLAHINLLWRYSLLESISNGIIWNYLISFGTLT